MNRTAVNRPIPAALNRGARALLHPILRGLRGFEVCHPERLPTHGPAIVAANHAAFSDTLYLTAAIEPPVVVFGAKPRLFKNRRRRALMAFANVLRVDGHDQYVEDGVALLSTGSVLLAYPEMGRNPSGLGPFETWLAEVALAAGVPITPVFLRGTTDGHVGGVTVAVGRTLPAVGTAQALTETLHEAVIQLAAP